MHLKHNKFWFSRSTNRISYVLRIVKILVTKTDMKQCLDNAYMYSATVTLGSGLTVPPTAHAAMIVPPLHCLTFRCALSHSTLDPT